MSEIEKIETELQISTVFENVCDNCFKRFNKTNIWLNVEMIGNSIEVTVKFCSSDCINEFL